MQCEIPRPGDTVWIRRRRWLVERATRERQIVRVDVGWRRLRRTFLAPFDQIRPERSKGRVRVRRQQAMARLAHSIARAGDFRLPLSVLDADAAILPHQIAPVLAVLRGDTRILIADEVGLGKTIQAGLIVAELNQRISAPRILILVPSSLRDQWQADLAARFAIGCQRADRLALESVSAENAFGANPWSRPGVWLASMDFVKQPYVIQALPFEPWDLVVIDEAHGACGDSDRYSASQQIARRARRVVLLTATPHSGDPERFERLMTLGAHTGVHESRSPLVFRRTRAGLGAGWPRHVRWHGVRLTHHETAALDELRRFEQIALQAAGADAASTRLLLSVFRKRALSTFAALSRSLERRLRWLGDNVTAGTTAWTQPRLFVDQADDDEGNDLRGLTSASVLGPERERRWLSRLLLLANLAARAESKLQRVVTLVERSSEPVVVFSEFRDSLEVLASRLHRSRSLACLHGELDSSEQRAELDRYLRGPASVLLATDVAGQGLNLHTRGRWVMSLELPWNPARLEQRLGRVDRLGQLRTPHFTLLVARHESERGLLLHLARRVLSARQSLGCDVLSNVDPPEAEVAAALLDEAVSPPGPKTRPPVRTPQSTEDSPSVPVSRRWARPAGIAARALLKRRVLSRAWRNPAGQENRMVQTRWSPSPRRVLVATVPIFNGCGDLIEQHEVALELPDALDDRAPTAIVSDARGLIESRLKRRLEKLQRAARRTARLLEARELEIADAIRTDVVRLESQPGLFDTRETAARASRERGLAQLASSNERRIEDLHASTAFRIGAVELAFVFESRR